MRYIDANSYGVPAATPVNSLPVCSQLCQSCKIQTVSQYSWHVPIEQAWKTSRCR